MMREQIKKYLPLGITAVLVFAVIYQWKNLINGFELLLSAARPILIGCITAYIVNIPMNFYENKLFSRCRSVRFMRMKRPLCMTAAILTLILVISIVTSLIVPELASCIKLLADSLPAAFERLEQLVVSNKYLSMVISGDVLSGLSDLNWNSIVKNMLTIISKGVGDLAGSVSKAAITAVSAVTTFVIGFIFSMYILAGKEKLSVQLHRLSQRFVKLSYRIRAKKLLVTANESFHDFIVGQCVEACILGVLCILGMLLFRFPYAVMIGTLIGFTALIPVAGAYIGAGVGALMILTVSPIKSLFFLIFILILQQVEGNLIYPRVVGSSIGLPGMWTLAAIIVGGGLFGIYGMLIGVPLTATVYKLLRENVSRHLDNPQNDSETDDSDS